MDWQKYKKLNFLVEQVDSASACVVLFHGYGADANDLASLSQVYQLNQKVDWYFPQGVLEVPIGPMMSGRAWFELRVSDFEKLADGTLSDQPIDPRDEKTLNEVADWLNHLGKLYDKVVIGGFSQGAILTSHSLYRLQFVPAGLLLLSGYLISPSAFPVLPDNLKVPFFQSHGQQDPVLTLAGARKLFEHMQSLGLRGEWHEFRGAHEIPMEIIERSKTFLNSVLGLEGSQS
jgi:phospholipase/carboxylesterase